MFLVWIWTCSYDQITFFDYCKFSSSFWLFGLVVKVFIQDFPSTDILQYFVNIISLNYVVKKISPWELLLTTHLTVLIWKRVAILWFLYFLLYIPIHFHISFCLSVAIYKLPSNYLVIIGLIWLWIWSYLYWCKI